MGFLNNKKREIMIALCAVFLLLQLFPIVQVSILRDENYTPDEIIDDEYIDDEYIDDEIIDDPDDEYIDDDFYENGLPDDEFPDDGIIGD